MDVMLHDDEVRAEIAREFRAQDERRARATKQAKVVRLTEKIEIDDERPAEYSDDALALRFVDEHADDLRFVATWNRWYRFDESRWREDTTLNAFDAVRPVCRAAAAEAMAAERDTAKARKLAASITSAKTVAAVHTLARADQRIAARPELWDSDPMLLNTPGGTVDLRTGELRAAKRGDYMTKSTTVAPADQACCPLWRDSLYRIFDGDPELISYFQRVCGYTLTADVSEQAVLFLYGTGGNGKNIVSETIASILGDYAVTAPEGLLIEQKYQQHPTELTVLYRARMASASEIDPGRAWAEARLKALSGGDKISARYMRGDPFEFAATAKLWIRANHKPRLRTVDPAIRRRLHLIPCRHRFEGAERDPKLFAKLEAEHPAILRWAIEGCLDWQREGLCPPRAVVAASEDYFADHDAIESWLTECCEQSRAAECFTRRLYESWRAWAEARNERVGSEAEFVERLEGRGFERFRSTYGRGLRGVRVMSDDEIRRREQGSDA
jgi:putative DNA primase/helicase